jgi:2-oxoglutarate ferredoxin oxidoreductase subunit beta
MGRGRVVSDNGDTAGATLTAKDFASDQDVRWCPGCGDYAVLAAVRKALPKLGHPKEDYVFVSGIGCAARFPYYMDTYGLHSIHGRALAVATGIKISNPKLKVVVVSGDGDLLSIGASHTFHAMRRNVDLTIVLLNNRIYGLTKGQYSPTSEHGKITATTPEGSLDYPVNPVSFAAAAGCTFIARAIDVDQPGLDEVLRRAIEHEGTSFVEVYQDCNIFNHGAWFYASQKDSRPDNTIRLEHGEPLVYGADRNKGILFRNGHPIKVTVGDGATRHDLVVHDETHRSRVHIYSQMVHPEFPEVLGVLYANPERPTYDAMIAEQMNAVEVEDREGELRRLMLGSETWRVEEQAGDPA